MKQFLARIVGNGMLNQGGSNVPSVVEFGRLCGACDVEQRQLHPFHHRQFACPDGFLQSILPTKSADDDGNLSTIRKCCKNCYNHIYFKFITDGIGLQELHASFLAHSYHK